MTQVSVKVLLFVHRYYNKLLNPFYSVKIQEDLFHVVSSMISTWYILSVEEFPCHWARRGLVMAPVSYLAGGERLSHIHPSLLNLMRNRLFHAVGTSRTSGDPFIERDLRLSFSSISLLTVMDIRLKAVFIRQSLITLSEL